MAKHRLYLSGPMTGYQDLNFPLFHAETARLRSLGFDVVNPAEINPDGGSWESCMRRDIVALMSCDGIALLPEWNESRGARIERRLADELGLHVVIAASITTNQIDQPQPRRACQ